MENFWFASGLLILQAVFLHIKPPVTEIMLGKENKRDKEDRGWKQLHNYMHRNPPLATFLQFPLLSRRLKERIL